MNQLVETSVAAADLAAAARRVAHSLNNHLTVIVTHTDLVRQRFPEESVDRMSLDAVMEASQEAIALARELIEQSVHSSLTTHATH